MIEMPEYRRGVADRVLRRLRPAREEAGDVLRHLADAQDWPKKRVDSFYREYNRSMLADLTVHEAMPGHYLQLMHNNAFPSKVRAVFSSGAFVEGWAVYGEWLMSKYGFGGPKVRMQRQKMVLRLAANAILDHERPRRRDGREGGARPDDEGRLPGGGRGRRQVEARARSRAPSSRRTTTASPR